MQQLEKLSFSFAEIDFSVPAAHFLSGEPHGRWPPASHSAYEKRTTELGILVGGSFQPISGQLMQLLAAIIGHHCSTDASDICKQVFTPFLQWGRFYPWGPVFFPLASFDFHQNRKSSELSVFLKWTVTAFLKAEWLATQLLIIAARAAADLGTVIQRVLLLSTRKVYRFGLYTYGGKKRLDNEKEF